MRLKSSLEIACTTAMKTAQKRAILRRITELDFDIR